jgi:hypothetical protein
LNQNSKKELKLWNVATIKKRKNKNAEQSLAREKLLCEF